MKNFIYQNIFPILEPVQVLLTLYGICFAPYDEVLFIQLVSIDFSMGMFHYFLWFSKGVGFHYYFWFSKGGSTQKNALFIPYFGKFF
jgi:hypothetical protein